MKNLTNIFSIQASDNYDFGFQIGELFKKEIQNRVLDYVKDNDFDIPNLPLVEEVFPEYIQELKGMADGAQIESRKILQLNCDTHFRKGCSTMVKKEEGKLLIGHNEDTSQKISPSKIGRFIEARIGGENLSSYMYFGELLGDAYAWNEDGLYLFMDYIDGIDQKITKETLPMYFIFRRVLDCSSMDQALGVFKSHPVSTGYHCLIAQKEDIFSVEAFYDKVEIERITDNWVHTNYFTGSLFKGKDKPILNSTARLERVKQLLDNNVNLNSILTDSENHPNAVCGGKEDELQTLSTIIVDPLDNKIVFHQI